MGEKNFMEAGTEIEALIDKKMQCLVKISNTLAEACITRAKNGKLNSIENDINNLIASLPAEDQVIVLRKLSVTLTNQLSGGKRSSDDDGRKYNNRHRDIFANRNF